MSDSKEYSYLCDDNDDKLKKELEAIMAEEGKSLSELLHGGMHALLRPEVKTFKSF